MNESQDKSMSRNKRSNDYTRQFASTSNSRASGGKSKRINAAGDSDVVARSPKSDISVKLDEDFEDSAEVVGRLRLPQAAKAAETVTPRRGPDFYHTKSYQ